MSAAKKFLQSFPKRPLQLVEQGLKPEKLILGKGDSSLEVAVFSSDTQPNVSKIKNAHKKRKNNRASPVLLTVIHGNNQASLCGPSGENPPVYQGRLELVERFCQTALEQPNRHKALEFCHHFLPSVEGISGINNKGMLASHHLIHGVKKRHDWEKARQKSKSISDFKRQDLLEELGFYITRLDNLTYILKSKDKKRALAVLLDPSEAHYSSQQRFNQLSPVSYAMDKADQEAMPWVLMVQENCIRLYSTDKKSGVSGNSRTETYIECQSSLLQEEDLGYLWLIFSAEALSEKGSLSEILEKSKRFSENVAKNLKDRIYDKIIPQIANGMIHAMKIKNPSSQDLDKVYHKTLTVLFRLLFIAHAEDRDLLPYKTNSAYQARSLKKKAQELSDLHSNQNGSFAKDQCNHWQEVARLWKAIDEGNTEWGIMAYNGGLFSSIYSEIGKELSKISIANKFFVPALKDLLLMKSQERDLAPVDFRFLGPSEFGTIYEGLLESNLVKADENLTLSGNIYIPVKFKPKNQKKKEKNSLTINKGHVYLQNQSGARKASGSYYTKSFIVEHILEKSLEPALKKHFERLDKLDDKEAAKEIFNFFVADIAMGSGHFLVAAVDKIEKAMTNYLNERPLNGVQNILDKIKVAVKDNLKDMSDDSSIENRKILARHIAKHCIYGVDNNELAVQLAKLSLWTHTFIPGLPLSYFDHNLACGDSLVGIGTLQEFQEEFKDVENFPMQLIDTKKLIAHVRKPLQDMKQLADLNPEEVKQNRKLKEEIETSLKDTKALFDIAIFNRISSDKLNIFKIEEWIRNKKAIGKSKEFKKALSELKDLKPLHFPLAFPEVFLRGKPGFDVIIGNPPWEKIKLEEHAFWARYFPGLRGLSQGEREERYRTIKEENPALREKYQSELEKINKLKSVLKKMIYIQSNSGDSDLYKFFCWRFWQLICEKNGFLGVVLKGSVCQSKGSENFRKEIFQKTQKVHITTFVNNSGWVFEGVDGIRISILSLEKDENENKKEGRIYIQGPFKSMGQFEARQSQSSLFFTKNQVESWTDSASLPSLPKEESFDVFLQLRKSPRLSLNDKKSWIT